MLRVQGRRRHPWLLGEGPPSLRRVLPQCEPPAPDPPTTGPGGPSTLGPEASWTGWLLLLTDLVLLWGAVCCLCKSLDPRDHHSDAFPGTPRGARYSGRGQYPLECLGGLGSTVREGQASLQ